MTPAERKRIQRQRARRGERIIRIAISAGTGDWLVEKGLLDEWDSDDPNKIAEALERGVRMWISV